MNKQLSSETVISVQNIGKKYYIGEVNSLNKSFRDVLSNIVSMPFKKVISLIRGNTYGARYLTEPLWALKDVSFDIKRGDVVGIIGANGAGKSTLLKILSRITEPTVGEVRIRGRVASLLEVGTGFHPELTGRENVFLNGAILGMRKHEINKKFDEIIDFAEVNKFIDTPVKHYSSGMYLRLAFSVAAHLEPEILIVDEVLAVGDNKFQKKCIGKMENVAETGRTVLFVSHNMQAISTLTNSCIVLSRGRAVYIGSTEKAINTYLQQDCNKNLIYTDDQPSTSPKLSKVAINTSRPNNVHVFGNPIEFEFEITAPDAINGASLSFQVFDNLQQPITHLLIMDSEMPFCRESGIFILYCKIPKFRLYIGQYTITVHFSERKGGVKFQKIEGICPFEVVVYGQLRDYYWYPDHAKYVEDCEWEVIKS